MLVKSDYNGKGRGMCGFLSTPKFTERKSAGCSVLTRPGQPEPSVSIDSVLCAGLELARFIFASDSPIFTYYISYSIGTKTVY